MLLPRMERCIIEGLRPRLFRQRMFNQYIPKLETDSTNADLLEKDKQIVVGKYVLESLPDESIHFLTRRLALHVILAAAYGYQFDWDGKDEI